MIDHLLQSTCCVAAAWLLTTLLRKNRAGVRYWIWLAASLKFLVPFSLLVSVGKRLQWRTAPVIVRQQYALLIDQIAQPLTTLAPPPFTSAVAAPASRWLTTILLAVWGCGIFIGVAYWLRWWLRLRLVQRAAIQTSLNLPIPVKSAPGCLEPGVFGIWKPVLLLPEGIAERLTPQQLRAVLEHELCHVARRDNLTAALHMIVETIFWFYPFVWFLRMRLIAERERACDEEVLRLGNLPMTYAEGILEVCKHYVESPLACVAGIGGANLRRRIESIMANSFLRRLSLSKKLLLASVGMLALIAPVTIGILSAPVSPAQQPAPSGGLRTPAFVTPGPAAPGTPGSNVPKPVRPAVVKANPDAAANAALANLPRFTTATITPVEWHMGGVSTSSSPGSIDYKMTGIKRLVNMAWPMPWFRYVWPADLEEPNGNINAWYNISATFPADTTPEQLELMFQALLADRFKMSAHWETRNIDIYALKLGPGGIKFQKSADPSKPGYRGIVSRDGWHAVPRLPREPVSGPSGMTLAQFTQNGASPGFLERPLVDMTGLEGVYDIDLTVPRDPNTPWPMQAIGPPATATDQAKNQGWSNAAFFQAMETQLGLTVEPQTVPTKILVIDDLDLVPSTN